VLFVSRAHAVFGGPEALAPLGLVTLAFPGGVKDLCRVLSADHYDPVGVAQHDVAGSHRDAAAADRVVHRAEPALVRSPDREAAGEDRKAQLRDRRSVAHEAIDHEAGGALRASLLGEQVPPGSALPGTEVAAARSGRSANSPNRAALRRQWARTSRSRGSPR
jgi:hypothetical protein